MRRQRENRITQFKETSELRSLDRFGTRETWGQGASAAAMSSNDGADK